MVRMILDVDSVGDDILAIFFAAGRPDVKVEAVTTENGACGSLEQATRVALNALTVAGREDIPVIPGAPGPIVGNPPELAMAPVHLERKMEAKFGDRLKDFNPPAPEPNRPADSRNAVNFIIDTIMNNPHEITLVTTGPVTNVGLALLQEPRIAEFVKECIVMGGVFGIPGNMTPVVEYNIWADPEAAKIMFNSGMPITVVGLDVCENNEFATSMLTRDDLDELAECNNPVARKMCSFLPIYIDIWREFFGLVGFPLDDVIAVAMAIDEGICEKTGRLFVDVETEGKLSRGQTVAYRGFQILPGTGKANTRICTSIDGRRFLKMFKETIARYPQCLE